MSRRVLCSVVVSAGMFAVGASGASASLNPCAPVKGVSRCVFGIQAVPGGPPVPLASGQEVLAEWWGRGSYFSAGRYSFLCHQVIFDGASVAQYAGGSPVFAIPSSQWVGYSGAPCTSSLGNVAVTSNSAHWIMQLSVKESPAAPGQFTINDLAKTSNREPMRVTAAFNEAGVGPIVCTWKAMSVKGTSPYVAGAALEGTTAAAPFKLDTEAAGNSPLCPAKGSFETDWRFSARPPSPSGGPYLPVTLQIH